MRREHNIEQGSILPSGYQPLEYIESHGSYYMTDQWIDTGVFCNNRIVSIELDFQCTNETTNDDRWIFGVLEGWYTSGYNFDRASFTLGKYNSKFDFLLSDYTGTTIIGNYNIQTFDNNRHYFVFNKKNIGCKFDNTILSAVDDYNVPSNEKSLFVFGRNRYMSTPVNIGQSCKIYSCVISIDYNIVRNYVPALRLSDNKPGLLDLEGSICPLTNTPFYINAGSGEFLFPYNYTYTNLQYIQCTGTQYIDTGYKPNANTEVVYSCRQTESYVYGTNQAFFGCSNGAWNNNPFTMCTYHNGAVTYGTSGNTGWGTFTTTVGQDMELKLNKNGGYVNDTMVFDTSSYSLSQMTKTLLFGAENYNSVTEYGKHRIYSAQIYESGNLVRNFVPKLRSDGKPGLLDLEGSICSLTGTPFYINAGTGEFQYA